MTRAVVGLAAAVLVLAWAVSRIRTYECQHWAGDE